MFELKSNQEIGSYFAKLMDEKYKNTSDFCRAYMEELGENVNDKVLLQKKRNKMTAIRNGNQSIVFNFRKIEIKSNHVCSAGK